MKATFILFLLLIVGCTDAIPLQGINYNTLLTDDNSKVWLINKQTVNQINIANGHNWNKDLMIFYDSGKVEIIPMKALGKASPKSGHFLLDSDRKRLEISFPDEEWIMDLSYITEDSVFMSSAANSDSDFSIQIIPFQELN